MFCNWQKKEWPHFELDEQILIPKEAKFLRLSGYISGALAHTDAEETSALTIATISEEAFKTSEIEGEYLNRESLQSSLRRNFGLATDRRKVKPAEQGIAI